MRWILALLVITVGGCSSRPTLGQRQPASTRNCLQGTNALLEQQPLLVLEHETWLGPKVSDATLMRRIVAKTTRALNFKSAYKVRVLKPNELKIARSLWFLHRQNAASLGFDISQRLTNLRDSIVVLAPDEFQRAVKAFNQSGETLAFTLDHDLVVVADTADELEFIHLLNHELVHISGFRGVEVIPTATADVQVGHSGFSRFSQTRFDAFNEGFTEFINQQLLTKATTLPAFSRHKERLLSDSAPMAYTIGFLLVTELITLISQKSGLSTSQVAAIWTKGYLTGDLKALELVSTHFGPEGIKVLADFNYSPESFQKTWAFFGFSK
jgi:hypothetical protein